MITKIETGQFNTKKSEQMPRQRARHDIEMYVRDTELEDPPVQDLTDFSDLCAAQFSNRGIKELYSVRLHSISDPNRRESGIRRGGYENPSETHVA